MLLASDATTIRGNKTGVGYYSARLLERLTAVGGDDNPIDEILVLSNRELDFTPTPRCRLVDEGRFEEGQLLFHHGLRRERFVDGGRASHAHHGTLLQRDAQLTEPNCRFQVPADLQCELTRGARECRAAGEGWQGQGPTSERTVQPLHLAVVVDVAAGVREQDFAQESLAAT